MQTHDLKVPLNKPLDAVVVAQLVERLLPTPQVCGSNPVIGENFIHLITINCIEKTKEKEKEAGNAQLKKPLEWVPAVPNDFS